MENKQQALEEKITGLEKRIKRTERINNIGVGGFLLGGLGMITSLGYILYLATSSSLPLLSEYNKIKAAQSYTNTITDSELKSAVEENYATQLSNIKQQEEYIRQRDERDFYDRGGDYSTYLLLSSLAVIGANLSYSGFLRGRKKELEKEYYKSRAAK